MIKRWFPYAENHEPFMAIAENGQYVLHTDHLRDMEEQRKELQPECIGRIIAQKHKKIEALEQENARLREELEGFKRGMPDAATIQQAMVEMDEALAGGHEEDFVDTWLVSGWLKNIAAKVGQNNNEGKDT